MNFWQLLFIKTTEDNRKIYYPSIFSNGYVVNSEDEIQAYSTYGHIFYGIAFILFIIMAKYKLLRSIFPQLHLDLTLFFIILFIIAVLAVIYNYILSKIVFKKNERANEKYWVNNTNNLKFMFKFITKFLLFVVIATAILACALYYLRKIPYESAIPFLVVTGVVTVLIIYKIWQYFGKEMLDFSRNQMGQILICYAFGLIENADESNFSEKSNHVQIISNMIEEIPVFVSWLVEYSKGEYKEHVKCIKEYLRNTKIFNEVLYEKEIPEEQHKSLIRENSFNFFVLKVKNVK